MNRAEVKFQILSFYRDLLEEVSKISPKGSKWTRHAKVVLEVLKNNIFHGAENLRNNAGRDDHIYTIIKQFHNLSQEVGLDVEFVNRVNNTLRLISDYTYKYENDIMIPSDYLDRIKKLEEENRQLRNEIEFLKKVVERPQPSAPPL